MLRRLGGNVQIASNVFDKINLVSEDEIFEIAKDIALNVHPRATDAYFIATARLTNSILITNDRIMANNARKYGIDAYYLLEEFDDVIRRIR